MRKTFFRFPKKLFPQIFLKLFKRYSRVLFQRNIKPTSVRDQLLVYQYVIEMVTWKNKAQSLYSLSIGKYCGTYKNHLRNCGKRLFFAEKFFLGAALLNRTACERWRSQEPIARVAPPRIGSGKIPDSPIVVG